MHRTGAIRLSPLRRKRPEQVERGKNPACGCNNPAGDPDACKCLDPRDFGSALNPPLRKFSDDPKEWSMRSLHDIPSPPELNYHSSIPLKDSGDLELINRHNQRGAIYDWDGDDEESEYQEARCGEHLVLRSELLTKCNEPDAPLFDTRIIGARNRWEKYLGEFVDVADSGLQGKGPTSMTNKSPRGLQP
eukprot:g2478.t1